MVMKRHIYLKMKTLKDAQELFFGRFDFSTYLESETIPTRKSLGRITSEPIFAKTSSPNFHAAAMDGMAVLAEITYGTTEDRPKRLKVGKNVFPINTGSVLPPATNAVIMIEDVNMIDDSTVEIYFSAYPWQHVRRVGEDIVATELLLPQDHAITAYDMGALLAGGLYDVPVKRRPKVIIIPTGSELVHAEDLGNGALQAGKVVESNSVMLAGLVSEGGGESTTYDIIPDEYGKIKDALRRAVKAECHMIIVNAGSSAGSEDYTANAIEELGEVLAHGVTIMPGKPTVLGIIEGKPVVGNPGYPVSAVISFDKFVKPFLYKMQGIPIPKPERLTAIPSQKIPSKLGIEEFVRVKLGKVSEKIVATPLKRSAGVITSLTEADGIIRIPHLAEGITDDEKVEAELLRPREQILNTIVIIGSHDMTLDLLANEIKKWDNRLSISSSNVGSTGGLIALRKGNAHMCGSHLFDTQTGDYNFPYIRRYLKDIDVKVVNLTMREQGLMVLPGNPRGCGVY
jgi:molybdenum cofactor synthesis domain-containing protein